MCHFHIVCILKSRKSSSDSDDEYEDDYTGDCSSEENLVNDDDNLRLLYVEQRLRELMAQKLNEY